MKHDYFIVTIKTIVPKLPRDLLYVLKWSLGSPQEVLDVTWVIGHSSKHHPNFHWNQAKSENTDFFLSQLKSPETPKMGLISISNDKNANWTKFERNLFKIKRFKFFVAETPDSRRTFFKIALRPLKLVQSSLFLYPGVMLVPKF